MSAISEKSSLLKESLHYLKSLFKPSKKLSKKNLKFYLSPKQLKEEINLAMKYNDFSRIGFILERKA